MRSEKKIWSGLHGDMQTLPEMSSAPHRWSTSNRFHKGGGKSELLLALARNYHKRSLLLRRTFPQLEQSLIDRSKDRFRATEFYNVTNHVWNFPDSCQIRFGHLESFDHVYDYDSAQYDFIGFDEGSQFSRPMIVHMSTIARTVDRKQRVRIVYATNPIGEGVDWMIERWAPWLDETDPDPAQPGELCWYAMVENREVRREDGSPFKYHGELMHPRSRTYIPARLIDNPYLPADYRATLQLLPEPLRSQLLLGSWKVGQTDDPYQVIPRKWIIDAMNRWLEVNPNPRAALVMGVDVARGGFDHTVIARRYGNWYGPLEKHLGVETPDGPSVAQLVIQAWVRGAIAVVDLVTWGSSAYDQLRKSDYEVIGFNGSEHSDGIDQSQKLGFLNKRAEAYWKMREALDPASGKNLMLPDDPELLADLSTPRWELKGDRIKIEAKDDIKGRIGRSPDAGDAVVMALLTDAEEQMASVNVVENREYSISD